MKKKRFLSPIYFVMAVYALLAVIGILEFRCLANDTADQSYLLALNKVENTLAIIDPQNYNVVGRAPTGEGPHEIITSSDGKLAFVANYGTQQVLGSSLSVIDLAAKKEFMLVATSDAKKIYTANIASNTATAFDLTT